MATPKPDSTSARFNAEGGWSGVQLLGFNILGFAVGTLLLFGRSDGDSLSNVPNPWHWLGRLLQVFSVFGTFIILLDFIEGRFRGQSGTFSGECPYCGAPNKLIVGYEDAGVAGADCPKCRNRIVLKNGRFYQLDFSNPLDKRFAGISQGIGLVRTGIVVACFLPIAVVVGVFSGIFTFSLLGFFTPILLCLGISLTMQIRGVWLCWQTPDRVSGRQWITATLWLQGIALGLLILQATFGGASWMDLPINGSIFASQLAFLTYLMKLAGFLDRPDLVNQLWRTRQISIVIAVFTGTIGLPFIGGYKTLIFTFLGLFGFLTLLRYLDTLKLLKSHLDKTLTAPS